MKKTTIKAGVIPESYEKFLHPSGLEILLYPMEGFSSAYALFATKYGSVDRTFKTGEDADFVTVPDGIAHFLEHKLFESENGDAFTRYAATGASANAYTSFDRTAYLFSATDNFSPSLEILLDFVTDPYFTPETVEKEQGIIGQEITMYQDDPDWRVFFGMLQGLYHHNPVATDIAGSIESISHIDADLLYRCYHTFYNLHNMVLVVAGNFDPAEVLTLADRILQPAPELALERQFPAEPTAVRQQDVETFLAVANPLFQLGFKREPTDEHQDFATALQTEILLDMIAGDASPLYRRLYEKGLINATFSASASAGRGYAYSVFDGESRNPDAVRQAIFEEIRQLQEKGLEEKFFQRSKKAVWGRFVGAYGTVTGTAGLLLSSHIAGMDGYDPLHILQRASFADMEAILHRDFDPQRSTLSVVRSQPQ